MLFVAEYASLSLSLSSFLVVVWPFIHISPSPPPTSPRSANLTHSTRAVGTGRSVRPMTHWCIGCQKSRPPNSPTLTGAHRQNNDLNLLVGRGVEPYIARWEGLRVPLPFLGVGVHPTPEIAAVNIVRFHWYSASQLNVGFLAVCVERKIYC